jgi:hypothetical protein
MNQLLFKFGGFSAEVMADSAVRVPAELNSGKTYVRLMTMLLRFPRIVLAEFNTHRLFSRNSASSRAIPIKKMLQSVINDPFIPDRFPEEHTGMQSEKWITQDMEEYPGKVAAWLRSRDTVVSEVQKLHYEDHFSKQLANRLLEPFFWHTVVVTSSEWENYFALCVSLI